MLISYCTDLLNQLCSYQISCSNIAMDDDPVVYYARIMSSHYKRLGCRHDPQTHYYQNTGRFDFDNHVHCMMLLQLSASKR